MGQAPAWGRRPRRQLGRTEHLDRRSGPEPKVGAVRRLGTLGPGRRQPGRPLRPGLVGLLRPQPQHG
eukprot:2033846-Prorocentrum_lima.AAC.1